MTDSAFADAKQDAETAFEPAKDAAALIPVLTGVAAPRKAKL